MLSYLRYSIGEQEKSNPDLALDLKLVLRFLENACKWDIQQAVLEEERITSEKYKAAQAFLAVEAFDNPRQVLEEHRDILLTEEGIGHVKRMAKQLAERNNRFWQEILRLRVRFLEEVQAHNIDYAEKRYVKDIQNMMQ